MLDSNMQPHLKVVLDYVERYNKNDEDLGVALSSSHLSRLVNNVITEEELKSNEQN